MSSGREGSGSTEAAVAGFVQNPDIMIVCEGPELMVTAVNDAISQLMPGKTMLGLPFPVAFAELMDQQAIDLYVNAFATGEVQRGREWRIELEATPGERIVVYVDFAICPLRDGEGNVYGVLGRSTDVTEMVLQRRVVEQSRDTAQAQLHDAMKLSTTVQRALLPMGLPVLPQVDVDARYLLATDDTTAGGDWFDVVPRSDGTVALVVGDVVGHGVTAAATMGQLRAALHVQLLQSGPLADSVGVVDQFARTVEDAYAATLCVAVLDPSSGELEYVTAGHPPPLIIDASGSAHYLEPTPGGPLASGEAPHSLRTRLAAGDLLLLYTDGLVERPGRSLSQNTVELLQVASSAYANTSSRTSAPERTTERVCELTLEMLTRVSGYTDDITVLAAQRVPALAPLSLEAPAVPSSVGEVRRALTSWLEPVDPSTINHISIQHAVGELVANVVDHAYTSSTADSTTDAQRTVRVDARMDHTGKLHATVADTGRWSDADPHTPTTSHTGTSTGEPGRENGGGSGGGSGVESSGGRGLSMAHGLVDNLSVDRDLGGTTVRIRHRLTRPARMTTDADAAVPHVANTRDPDDLTVSYEPEGGTLVVRGPVELGTSDKLRLALTRATQGGTRPTVVDLTDVTVLSSNGVRVLFEFHTPHVKLIAPPGTPAQHVLDIVKLSHTSKPSAGDHGDDSDGGDPFDVESTDG